MNNEQSGLFSKIVAGVALLFAALSAWRFVEAFSVQGRLNDYAMMTSGLPSGSVIDPRDLGAPSVLVQWGTPVALLVVAVILGVFAVKRLQRAA